MFNALYTNFKHCMNNTSTNHYPSWVCIWSDWLFCLVIWCVQKCQTCHPLFYVICSVLIVLHHAKVEVCVDLYATMTFPQRVWNQLFTRFHKPKLSMWHYFFFVIYVLFIYFYVIMVVHKYSLVCVCGCTVSAIIIFLLALVKVFPFCFVLLWHSQRSMDCTHICSLTAFQPTVFNWWELLRAPLITPLWQAAWLACAVPILECYDLTDIAVTQYTSLSQSAIFLSGPPSVYLAALFSGVRTTFEPQPETSRWSAPFNCPLSVLFSLYSFQTEKVNKSL